MESRSAGDAAIEIIEAQEPDEKKRGVYLFTGNGESTIMHRAKKAPAAIARILGIEFRQGVSSEPTADPFGSKVLPMCSV
jgi:hypothetical protein